MPRRLLLLPFVLLLGAGPAPAGPPADGPFEKIAIMQLREKSDDMIDPALKASLLRRIEEVRAWGADCVIFDIESYGGLVTASIETGDEIYALGREVHTIAYVHRKAISGAAMLALACNEVVMNEVANIGDSQVIYAGADGTMQVAPEKAQGPVATKFRTYARGNGYPVAIAESMVRVEMEVTRYRAHVDPTDPSKGDRWAYVRTDAGATADADGDATPPPLGPAQEVVVRVGEIGMFSAEEALEYGVASRIVPDLAHLVDTLSGPETAVLGFDWTWAEEVSRWLLGMRALLFLVGAGALYFALKMPGTGVPEALALICFGLFFGASAVAGFAGSLELVLFFAGIVLIVVELFVLPGFGVPGFLGVGCLLASLGFAAIPEDFGDIPGPAPYGPLLLEMAGDLVLGALGAAVAVFVLARFLPTIPMFEGLRLAPPRRDPVPADGPAPGEGPLSGTVGTAASDLRPSGRARIAGEMRDVVAEGAWIPRDARVRVVEVRGPVVVVRRESGPEGG